MITDKDIEKLKTVFITRDEVTKIVNKQAVEFKDSLLSIRDEIIGEVRDSRINILVSTQGYGDRLEEHDKRIEKIEESCGIQSES